MGKEKVKAEEQADDPRTGEEAGRPAVNLARLTNEIIDRVVEDCDVETVIDGPGEASGWVHMGPVTRSVLFDWLHGKLEEVSA